MTKEQDTGGGLRSLYGDQGGVRSIFSTKAEDYAASRPDYPAGLFETLKASCATPISNATVADIGAGTGLLTQGLLRMGCRVVAIEPNLEMRHASDPRELYWPHEHSLGEDGLLSLVFSRSYMPGRAGDDGRRAADRVRQVFSRFADNGKVGVRYRTVAFFGRPTAS